MYTLTSARRIEVTVRAKKRVCFEEIFTQGRGEGELSYRAAKRIGKVIQRRIQMQAFE